MRRGWPVAAGRDETGPLTVELVGLLVYPITVWLVPRGLKPLHSCGQRLSVFSRGIPEGVASAASSSPVSTASSPEDRPFTAGLRRASCCLRVRFRSFASRPLSTTAPPSAHSRTSDDGCSAGRARLSTRAFWRLPSVGAEPADECSLAADAAAVVRVLDGGGGPFLVCGHSYGGMVVTQATAGRSDVTRLVYLCAFMPDAGDSLFTITGGAAPWIDVLDDGRTLPDLEQAAAAGLADCDAETRARAIARLRPQVPAPFLDPVPMAAWREIPTTYVVCTQDQSLPVELQRDVFAPRADDGSRVRSCTPIRVERHPAADGRRTAARGAVSY